MKKYIYLLGFLLFIGLFMASPYILDYWQYKSALEAAGGMSVYEGATSEIITTCTCSNQTCTTCAGIGMCASASACLAFQGMTVTMSAGGMPCKNGYLLTLAQGLLLQNAQNVIIGGTTCTNLAVVASEKGCLGCAMLINNPKVYAFKNKMKEIINFIIAGKRESKK